MKAPATSPPSSSSGKTLGPAKAPPPTTGINPTIPRNPEPSAAPSSTTPAAAPGTLVFNAKNRDPYGLNILGYNNDIQDLYSSKGRSPTLLPVGDLHLETVWTPDQNSAITLTAGTYRNLFSATWSDKGLELKHWNMARNAFEPVTPQTLVPPSPPVPGHAYQVEFNNVDHSVQVFIDGKMVLEHLTDWNADLAHKESEDFQDPQQHDTFKPRVTIDVTGRCTLAHLKLMRDLYYTQSDPTRPYVRNPGAAAGQDNPLTLGPDEFFAMGDNSRRSHDGRTWETVFPALDDLGTRRGIVPRRYLLGKAFFVYWPAGFRPTSYEKLDLPLVPNTGEMRFIR